MRFEGKTVVVTGAAKGIGAAIAVRFASEGANVVLSDIDESAGRATTDAIVADGGSAIYRTCDVLDRDQIVAMFDTAKAEFGAVDVLINNAGGAIVAGEKLPLWDTEPDSILRMLGINLMGTVWCTHAIVGAMRERRSGRIVNMSSVSGIQGGTPSMYATAKGAIIAFTKSIAAEMAEYQVTVNCISPWAIATREGPAALPTRIGRKGTAEDVANLAAFLASDEASFVTGSNYVMDGGWTSGR